MIKSIISEYLFKKMKPLRSYSGLYFWRSLPLSFICKCYRKIQKVDQKPKFIFLSPETYEPRFVHTLDLLHRY
jgi:hypothetical protein